jgi:hypothetical protein
LLLLNQYKCSKAAQITWFAPLLSVYTEGELFKEGAYLPINWVEKQVV